jgi:hypothetical protein
MLQYFKVTIKLLLRLTKHRIVKTYGRVEVKVHVYLTVALMNVSGQLHTPAD